MPVIRAATESDLSAICTLGEDVNAMHHEAFPAVFAAPGEPQRHAAHWAASLTSTDRACFVAVVASGVVGFITLSAATETHSLFQPLRYARVGTVAVEPRARGRGIGSALMAKAEAWAVEQGAQEVRLNVWTFNQGAVRLYRELGYQLQVHQFAKPVRRAA